MGLSKPISVYVAASNLEADMLALSLERAGIEAHITYDESPAGYWMFGRLAEIHRPQVWVDESQFATARGIVGEFENSRQERKKLREIELANQLIEVVCEECGAKTNFPASQKESTRDCPNCAAFVDVGEPEDIETAGD